jgi:DNA-3-methyladenine glycosylase I
VRNRLKIQAAIQNARALLKLQADLGSFDAFLWQFVDGQPLQNVRQSLQDIPAKTEISDALSKELKRRDFTFVGSTICYAFMQAVGMTNDHISECFRWQEVKSLAE